MVMQAHQNREVLESLMRAYWSPVFAYIRKQGYTEQDSSDLTQEFMTHVVIGRNLTSRASPSRGRFRTFVKASLGNFLVDEHRAGRFSKRQRRARQPDASQPTATALAEAPKCSAEEEFDRRWARAVLRQTLEIVREQCLSEGMSVHWAAFEAAVVIPNSSNSRPPALDALASRLLPADEHGAERISNMIQTVKRKFKRALREVIGRTVDSPLEIDREISDLRATFGAQ